MRVTVDIPDKYITICKSIMEFYTDDGEYDEKDFNVLESLKGKDVVLEIEKGGPENTKELCVGMVMLVWAQEAKKKNSEV